MFKSLAQLWPFGSVETQQGDGDGSDVGDVALSLTTEVPHQLDLSYICHNVAAMGAPWLRRSEKVYKAWKQAWTALCHDQLSSSDVCPRVVTATIWVTSLPIWSDSLCLPASYHGRMLNTNVTTS